MKERPQTTVIIAITADGKIADKKGSAARFGSIADKKHLEKQIALADGVIFGARTLRAYGTSLPITNPELLHNRQAQQKPLQPVHLVCSVSGKFDPQLQFFHQPIPRWLITTQTGAKLWQHQPEFDRILVTDLSNTKPNHHHWEVTLNRLKQLGLNKLAILGGGQLIASLFQENLIDELWLTICPLILGGENSPTPVAGIGFFQSQGIKLQLLEVVQIEQEVFLHYLVNKSKGK
ncbi:MAG: RibD family protein [Xenococcaceae cyanobacterium MO_207.B15]|nr:RibD family protein [Xenococcaceae cyanobacterium MO_207.B15]